MIKFRPILSNRLMIIDEVKKIIEAEDNIIFAYLFGSMAAGRQTNLSDVDIAIYLRNTEGIAQYKLEIFNKITNAIGTDELDLIILNTAPIFITGRILQNKQILIDKDPSLRYKFESLILREYFDFKIKEEKYFSLRYGIV